MVYDLVSKQNAKEFIKYHEHQLPKELSDITGKHSIEAKINHIKNTSKNYMLFNIIDAENKLKQFAHITRMLTNYASIGECKVRFFFDGPQKC